MYTKPVFWDALLYAMEGENPANAIENEEKREQKAVIRTQQLPKKVNAADVPMDIRFNGVDDNMDYDTRHEIIEKNTIAFTKSQYEMMGIKVLSEYDDLFFSIELPENWEIKATDHAMWNSVFDDKGRERISFFYKGAFYDRDAFSQFNRRYGFRISPFDNYESNATRKERMFKPWTLHITDCGQKTMLVEEIICATHEEYLYLNDKLRRVAIIHLNELYPDWEDINAYWD